MRVSNIRIEDSPYGAEQTRVAADITYDSLSGEDETLWFDIPAELAAGLECSADPWFAALLPLASKLGESLRIDAMIDPFLYEGRQEMVEWWQFWFPAMHSVEVHVEGINALQSTGSGRNAQFFSGGVDSYFTLLRHMDDADTICVDDLLIGWGFDIPMKDEKAFSKVRNVLQNSANELGKKLVPFATNIRETQFRRVLWGPIGHGNAMAAVALLLQQTYGRILIPSTDGYRETGPWGSHATTDHMYSSTIMRIIHEGSAYTRFQKVELAAKSPAALASLRVCWRSQTDENCGECEKCLRTIIALELCDALASTKSFAHASLDVREVARVYCPHTKTGTLDLYYEEMRDEALARGRNEIARAINKSLRRSRLLRPFMLLANRLAISYYLGPIGRPFYAALQKMVVS